MTRDDVVRMAQAANLQQVQFLFVDNGGIIRGKVTHAHHLAKRLAGGIGLTPAMQAMNILDQLQPIPGMGPVGEVRLVPDPDTFRVLPYQPRTGSVLCDLHTLAREPWEACPRSFLKRMVAKAADAGIRVLAAYEGEFTLAYPDTDGFRPIDEALCFSSTAMYDAHPVIAEIMDALTSVGIMPEQYYPELGHGQHELSVSPAEALAAADNQVRYRETVRAVAKKHGMAASFAPKPFLGQPGNGAHIHFSLWDTTGQKSLLWDPEDPYRLSPLGYHFAAGVLRHLPGLVALTCASTNSYRRLNPRSWSSAYTAFGPDNREAAVRIASTFWGQEEQSVNLELKASDASANPYLALGALIAAGLDGVAHRWHPGAPVLVDPDTLSEAERHTAGIHRLPATLGEALDALADDTVLRDAMGPLLYESYTTVKRSEFDAFALENELFEISRHFLKY